MVSELTDVLLYLAQVINKSWKYIALILKKNSLRNCLSVNMKMDLN